MSELYLTKADKNALMNLTVQQQIAYYMKNIKHSGIYTIQDLNDIFNAITDGKL